jgi:multidrug efflux pump subunit AcrB
MLDFYERWVRLALVRPGRTVAILAGLFLAAWRSIPFLGLSFFPRTDAGQFTINLKAPTGTRIEVTEQYVAKVEDLIRKVVDPKDFKLVVSNIGVVPDFSALYTTNAGSYTATVQVQLEEDHRRSSFEYMAGCRRRWRNSSGDSDVFPKRFDGGRDPEHGHAGSHRRAGEQPGTLRQSSEIAQDLARQFRGNYRAWARFTYRRT